MEVEVITGCGAIDLSNNINQFLNDIGWSYKICFTNYVIETPAKHIALIYYER